jgi:hypothetical protein
VDYHCPHCHARNRIQAWTIVNAARDPHLAERILDGSLFEFSCRGCEAVHLLDHALLFCDEARSLAILHAPPADPLMPDEKVLNALSVEYQLRVVEDGNAFRELVHVWQDRLDDAAMLLLKHMLAARVLEDTGVCPVMCSFDARVNVERQEWLEYIVFQTEERAAETLRVPLSVYQSLEQEIAPQRASLFPNGQWIAWDDETAQQVWETLQNN